MCVGWKITELMRLKIKLYFQNDKPLMVIIVILPISLKKNLKS